MRILTVVGTRPELIRLSQIIPKLDSLCNHTFVHTGQSYDKNMRDVFFDDLGLRQPDYQLSVKASSAMRQICNTMTKLEGVLNEVQPDRMLVLGDTNSVYAAAYVAKRLGVTVYHMEAGNRCFNRNMPEEINRMAIDHIVDVHMPYTGNSRANLLREGIASNTIYVTGNPIFEVMESVEAPDLPEHLGEGKFFLVTVHREENVENRERLRGIIMACSRLATDYHMPVIFSRHPRTKARMDELGIGSEGINFIEPVGFLEFMAMERDAFCVITDSGTVPEECCLRATPCVMLRDNTERPELIECGATVLSGVEPGSVLRAVKVATNDGPDWLPPEEYLRQDVSDTVVKIVLGYQQRMVIHHGFPSNVSEMWG